MPAVLDAIPADAVRITIDKDVLPEHEALTKQVPGTDLCGEYSPPRHGIRLKRIEARLDPPARTATDQARIDDNTRTDCELA